MNNENRVDPSERQIVTIRIFTVPRQEVFNAWSDPEKLSKWWGPNGFTNSFDEFNFRPSGNWKFTMHGPDGGNYFNHSVFVEIQEPERIILRHLSKPHFQLTADFKEIDKNRTQLIFQQLFDTVEEYNKVKVFAVDANEENMDRLEVVLKKAKT